MDIDIDVLANRIVSDPGNTVIDIVDFVGRLYEESSNIDYENLKDFTRQVVQLVPEQERNEFITSLFADEVIARIDSDIPGIGET